MIPRGLLLLLGVLVCSPLGLAQESMEEDGNWKQIQMPFNYQNVQVPREFWDFVKSTLIEDGASEKQIDNFAVSPITTKVELSSEDPMVLRNQKNYRLTFTEGGGVLDLFDYVSGKGEFFMRFSPELTNENPFHLFYISDSPGKKVGGDNWGNGCGRIFDLTEKAGQFLLDRGVKLTGSRRHYLHLMAGNFVFFQLVDERLFLGYIRVADSRYPQFKCKES
ncbi:MAG: hypothetical protein AAF203_00260 [Pseudomonadota bacterium]